MSFLQPQPTRSTASTALMVTATTAMAGCVSYALYEGYHRRFLSHLRSLPPKIYDIVILNMTELWYRDVLGRLEDGSTVLDVGIGTAGALLRCANLVQSKNLRIVGLDYNDLYIDAAQQSIADAGLDDRIKVVCMSVYDEAKLNRLGDLLDDTAGSNEELDGEAPPKMPLALDDTNAKSGLATIDRTQDSRTGHHHPHLSLRGDRNPAKAGTVEALRRTASEAQSEAASEAERESNLHDLLEHNNAEGKPELRRMDTPKADENGDDDSNLHTPKVTLTPAQHPRDAHDYSPPPTPGRDHNVHWEKEPPMPDFLSAADSTDARTGADVAVASAATIVRMPRKSFDAVYFSGSISLLPDPPAALDLTAKVLKAETGKVYITQTYQRRTPPLLRYIKPAIKFLTTIDFGQLVTEKAILDLYAKAEDLEVETHKPIEKSVDNKFQCAYVSVLKQKTPEDCI